MAKIIRTLEFYSVYNLVVLDLAVWQKIKKKRKRCQTWWLWATQESRRYLYFLVVGWLKSRGWHLSINPWEKKKKRKCIWQWQQWIGVKKKLDGRVNRHVLSQSPLPSKHLSSSFLFPLFYSWDTHFKCLGT